MKHWLFRIFWITEIFVIAVMPGYRQLTLRDSANFHTFIDLPKPQS
jgi:hypothetical protein